MQINKKKSSFAILISEYFNIRKILYICNSLFTCYDKHYMNNKSFTNHRVRIQYTEFFPEGKAAEIHAMFCIEEKDSDFTRQFSLIDNSLKKFSDERIHSLKPVMARYFSSDVANQEDYILKNSSLKCPFSIVGQSPLDGSKVSLWVWFSGEGNNYRSLRIANRTSDEAGAYLQTVDLLESYEAELEKQGMNIANHCVRTWFFVQDVDTNYGQVVKGRKENFMRQNLTEKTHYIASTGIEAKSGGKYLVKLDAIALYPLEKEQIQYLYAPSHLNPTYEYGVTFERGSVIKYGDRRHIFISGTASINNKGEVLFQGDIVSQTHRVWENVETLLKEGGASYKDVNYFIVYLRDIADFNTVNDLYEKNFPEIPRVVVLAPVCRPAWLVEMECMATVADCNSRFADL